ncbi:type I restriction-modification system restriction subunit R [Nonlabens ulvanivorans]|uniref:type I site-specific deoxyribonuclease n=1 Tax=Nonlabens ulvanivorans TaxID=906888 RepID=A0A090QE74_NONUL|nr:type I restriction endonuclease [Nonlabens ulvanivorans]GAL00508.1 type I restriction-modification system restriction subunit R [Nonlabens ulvanivorans]
MTKLYESDIELLVIEDLEALGYEYVYGPQIAPDGEAPERDSYANVVLENRLRNAITRLNPLIPNEAQQDAFNQVMRIASPELLANNEAFHKLLTEGVTVEYQKDGQSRGDKVWLVDFSNYDSNEFLVVNQFTIIEDNYTKRPDVLLFINGLPLVVIELKNATDENATLRGAYKQLQTYKETIPSLFTFNALCIISDGLEAKTGSVSAGFTRFMNWKTVDGLQDASHLDSQIETLVKGGQLNKHTLLDLIRYFIVFEKSKNEDLKTGITTIDTVKKVAAYHQYYAVNKAVLSTVKASATNGGQKRWSSLAYTRIGKIALNGFLHR